MNQPFSRPKSSRSNPFYSVPGMLLALAAGYLAGYFLDPQYGRGRRIKFSAQAGGNFRKAMHRLTRMENMVTSRANGMRQRMMHRKSEFHPANDAALTQKVETELYRNPDIPKDKLNINTQNGVVVVRGEVPTPQVRKLIENKVHDISGVGEVQSLLHLPGEEAPNKAEVRHIATVHHTGPSEFHEKKQAGHKQSAL